MSLMKKLKVSPNSDRCTGQKGAENHAGTISVPCSLQFFACNKTLETKGIGGQTKLFSCPQSQTKVSMDSEPGFQYLELYLCSFIFK